MAFYIYSTYMGMANYSVFKIFIVLFLVITHLSVVAQSGLKVYKANKVNQVDLSPKAQKDISRMNELSEKEKLSASEQKELDALFEKYGEGVESIWSVEPIGCSWYCGGGNYKVVASSKLTSGELDYSAESANDLDYQTAWVEGKEDEGIGEYLEYHFTNESPRVTSVIISNGYLKSKTSWKNNNRVKTFKLYVNNKPFGLLEMEDVYGDHVFELATFGRNADGSDLILRFEIVAVYKGDKYNDTAITEIYFDGIDVH